MSKNENTGGVARSLLNPFFSFCFLLSFFIAFPSACVTTERRKGEFVRLPSISELEETIARLQRRQRASIAHPLLTPGESTPISPKDIEEVIDGEVRTSVDGSYFCSELTYTAQRCHGSFHLSRIADLGTYNLAAAVERLSSNGRGLAGAPEQWVYLDCETTGVDELSGNYAFLIGLLSCDGVKLRLRQYLMRSSEDERAMLRAVARDFSDFATVITFNGTVFDLPLLESRFAAHDLASPFVALTHFDALYPARRIWKLRLNRCRLLDLESDLLGLDREEDVRGEFIPYLYFEFVRRGDALRVSPIFHHNACDLLTLACLTAKLLMTVLDPAAELSSGVDRLAHAAWSNHLRVDTAPDELRSALARPLPEPLEVRAAYLLAEQHRKKGKVASALAIWEDLAGFSNPAQIASLERLAKHREHAEKDPAAALACVERALAAGADGPEWMKRHQRLVRRCGVLENTALTHPGRGQTNHR